MYIGINSEKIIRLLSDRASNIGSYEKITSEKVIQINIQNAI